MTAHVQDIVRSCGYSNARSGGGLTPTGPAYTETVPPADMFATRTWAVPGGRQITLADLQQEVLAASSHGGGWLQIQGHMVCSQQFFPSDYADCIQYYGYMELTTLNAFLDWLQNAGLPGGAPAGVTTQTVRQVIGPVLGSDVTAPATTISCNGAACTTGAYGPGVTVALTALDAGSGVERTVYTTDESDPTTSATALRYTGPFTLARTSTVRYLSADQAMNAETGRSQRINDRCDPARHDDPVQRGDVLDRVVPGARHRDHDGDRRRGVRARVHALHDRRLRALAREPALHRRLPGHPDHDRAVRVVGQRGEPRGREVRDDPDRRRRTDGRDHVAAERRDRPSQRGLCGVRHGGRRGDGGRCGLRDAERGLVPGRQRLRATDRYLEPLHLQLDTRHGDGARHAHDDRGGHRRRGQHDHVSHDRRSRSSA